MDTWMDDYNLNRTHTGKYCFGKTPMTTFIDSIKLAKEKYVEQLHDCVVIDKNGFLIAVMVTVANIADCRATYLLMRTLKDLCSGVKVILVDGGYRGEIIETVRKAFGYPIQVVVSNFKEQGFHPLHKRWIVEITFSWFDNYRRLCRNYELTFDSTEEMVKIASIRFFLNKI
jgi:putative transposase